MSRIARTLGHSRGQNKLQTNAKVPGAEAAAPNSLYSLPKEIAAITAMADDESLRGLSSISTLPMGAKLELIGGGFNNRTVRVRWNEQMYFVYCQDLENILRP